MASDIEEKNQVIRKEVCNIFYGALSADDATAFEEHLEEGQMLISDDQSEALADQVINLFLKFKVSEVVEHLPTMLEQIIPEVPEYVRELAYPAILESLYHDYGY